MFESIEKLADDPILGLTTAFLADTNPKKINLGVGVYKDPSGHTPIMGSVKKAEELYSQEEDSKVYIAPAGYKAFNDSISKHILGVEHSALGDNRVGSVMTPGGCGALRVGGELIQRARPGAKLWVSDPTWPIHRPLLATAGLEIVEYPYYDEKTRGLKADEMLETLKNASSEDAVLLHACCHNPTGVDLKPEHWDEIAQLAQKNGFLPFIDMAYHGLGVGLEEDCYGLRLLAETVPEMLISYSCSKNFGLYRERIGTLLSITKDKTTTDSAVSHIQNIARTMYSMPPAHGGAIVMTILNNPELYQLWKSEVEEIRLRIEGMRKLFVETMKAVNTPESFDFILEQKGMFSFLGINDAQIARLRDEFGIYMAGSSRVNIAGISDDNVEYLAQSLVGVLK